MADGYSAVELFEYNKMSLSYDDIILLPGFISESTSKVDLTSKLTRNIKLRMPIVSAPMDTITESDMATAMALLGGIGIIHCNMSIDDMVKEVNLVKRFENGFVQNPMCLKPTSTVSDWMHIKDTYGYKSVPITADGKRGSKLLGLVTNTDIYFEDSLNTVLADIMTTDLVVGKHPMTLREANKRLFKSKKGVLPIVNEDHELLSIVTKSDYYKNKLYPNASKDENKQLLVGAALSTRNDAMDRAKRLIEAKADVIVVESSQGNSLYQIDLIKQLKSVYPDVQIAAGNVVTVSQAKNLIDAGCDAIKVGMGIGSICTTQTVTGVGRGQATAVYYVSRYAFEQCNGLPVIADGGVKSSGDVLKALSLGASSIMGGNIFSGTKETPGEYYINDGVRMKSYRGMGSKDAISNSLKHFGHSGSASRYHIEGTMPVVSQGVSGLVMDKGSVHSAIPIVAEGVRHGLHNMGMYSIDKLHESLYNGTLRFEVRSAHSIMDGGVSKTLTNVK
ncbi:inosine-5'-monophosphate dehydrogenase [Theileria orientalis]|uniref:Inosine-5'-monophosphate dehydrogenase n=1 Tax=Theileria orientalis TaxID=68886 RepID=A0A976MBV3_THEOR|nr:inosine-5'-monophosphate dehydrogenase [Theileria orientalis]